MTRGFTAGLLLGMLLLLSYINGDVHAYLDPGTGSIMLQTLLAATVGGLAIGRLYWRRLKSFLLRRHLKNEDTIDG
jgi:hypothetical protein